MKISFIAPKENPVSIFKELAGELSNKISGLELKERFVPSIEDLPIVAMEEVEEADFIFVFAIVEDENERQFLEDKLVDVELGSKTRILKAIEEDNFSDLEEEDYLEEKDSLVDKYSNEIISILFNEEEFEPQDKDFSI
jgi:riboflavin synthase